jgi:hypothetical protein
MILRPLASGALAVPQSAHALLAFQLAEHWGNRETPQPAPRADVLAAVLLHDAGWDDPEATPRLGPDGVPLAFDTWPAAEHEAIWRASVEHAACYGRYIAWLVSHHVSGLARRSSGAHGEFLAAEELRRVELASVLAEDIRYRHVLLSGSDAVNRAIVRITDALAIHLIIGLAGPLVVPEMPRRSGSVGLEVEPAGESCVRLHPWPLAGRRLPVSIEAMHLPAVRFADRTSFEAAWRSAPRRRLSWTLLRPGASER